MGQKGYIQTYYLLDNPIYLEMAEAYNDLVKILNEVSESGKNYSDEELIAFYSQWLSTKDKALERKLNRRGFFIGGVFES